MITTYSLSNGNLAVVSEYGYNEFVTVLGARQFIQLFKKIAVVIQPADDGALLEHERRQEAESAAYGYNDLDFPG